MKRFYFKGKPPSRAEDDHSDSDDNPLQPPPTVAPPSSRRRAKIEAKVLDPQQEDKSARRPRQGRKRIEAKVLGSDSIPSKAVSVVYKADAELSAKELSEFKPVREKKRQTNNLASLPELRSKNESSSSSESSESSDGSEALSSVEDEPMRGIDPKGMGSSEQVSPPVPSHVPVYVPSVARDEALQQATETKERRDMERASRKRALREETLRSAKHTVGETEYDLKYVDMSKFPDDTDRPEDQEEEYELWRVRELKRVMADRGIDVQDDSMDVSSQDEEKKAGPFLAAE